MLQGLSYELKFRAGPRDYTQEAIRTNLLPAAGLIACGLGALRVLGIN